MQQRSFDITGFDVPAIGYGAGTVGDGRLEEKQAERILNQVLDLGIGFIDTAKGYGLSVSVRRRAHSSISFSLLQYLQINYWRYAC